MPDRVYDLASGEGIGWKDPRRRVPDADGGVPADPSLGENTF